MYDCRPAYVVIEGLQRVMAMAEVQGVEDAEAYVDARVAFVGEGAVEGLASKSQCRQRRRSCPWQRATLPKAFTKHWGSFASRAASR